MTRDALHRRCCVSTQTATVPASVGEGAVKRDCKHGVRIKAALRPDVKWTV